MKVYLGIQGHASRIMQLIALPDGKTVMTLGMDEFTISIWSVNRLAVDISYKNGGGTLMPYVKALPGGRDGWLFREMQDLFYYMQILTTSLDSPEEHAVKDVIAASEAPDFMRALGFFPSEWEINTMLNELTEQRPNMAKHYKVSFGQLLKMYINFKPVFGYPIEVIRRNISYFCGIHLADSKFSIANAHKSEEKANDDWLLDRDQLMDVCCSHGEHMSRIEFARYLRVLLDDDETTTSADEYVAKGKGEERIVENMLKNLPEVFNLSDIFTNILGLKLEEPNVDGGVYAKVLDPGELEDQLKNNFKSMPAEDDNINWDE